MAYIELIFVSFDRYFSLFFIFILNFEIGPVEVEIEWAEDGHFVNFLYLSLFSFISLKKVTARTMYEDILVCFFHFTSFHFILIAGTITRRLYCRCNISYNSTRSFWYDTSTSSFFSSHYFSTNYTSTARCS